MDNIPSTSDPIHVYQIGIFLSIHRYENKYYLYANLGIISNQWIFKSNIKQKSGFFQQFVSLNRLTKDF